MRVLVTGGAGYIGSHTLLELMAQGHEVCVLDNYSNAAPEVLTRVRSLSNGQVKDYVGDVRDTAKLDEVMQDFAPEAVIHFAGLKAVGESTEKPLLYYDVNVAGTLALLHAMDRAGCKKIIFSSSATVYGDPVYLPYDAALDCGSGWHICGSVAVLQSGRRTSFNQTVRRSKRHPQQPDAIHCTGCRWQTRRPDHLWR